MKKIHMLEIEETIAQLCVEANLRLPRALCARMEQVAREEEAPLARNIMHDLLRNLEVAKDMQLPICQDTGMAVVFADIGQELCIAGGDFEQAVNRGVARGYREGYLRASMVSDPLRRENTGNNTPAILHTRLVAGDKLRLTIAPKGAGSENQSRLKMFNPAAGQGEMIEFVCQTVRRAGGKPCPPVVLGVGIGGNFEQVALLAKRALCREVGEHNPDPFYAALERELLVAVNALGVGPQGFGGKTTALWVAVEAAPTHIAALPFAVNVGCHVNRHATAEL